MTQINAFDAILASGGIVLSKIICEVCGTVYQDTADFCPICGYAQGEYPVQQEGFLGKSASNSHTPHKPIFDYDEDEDYSDFPPEPQGFDEDDDLETVEEYDQPSRASTIIIVLLVMLITLLLVAIGFLFFRFYLPNRMASPESQTVATAPATEAETEDATEPTIPCTSLALTSGVTQLTRPGQYWLLHVSVLPEDTTDPLIFMSEDETVVTVNEHGRLTAEGEGETNVYIACGEKEIKCHVIVRFEEETEPGNTEQTSSVPEAVEYSELPGDAVTEAPSEPQTEEGEAATGDIVLKLEKYDVSSSVKGVSFELKLACDLKPEEVTWLTMDSNVAIVKNGVVTTIGGGKTKIVAQYNGQQAECIVRCNF